MAEQLNKDGFPVGKHLTPTELLKYKKARREAVQKEAKAK